MRKRSTWLAWSMLAIFVVCLAVTVALSVLNGSFQRDPGLNLALLLAFTAFMVVGAVIVAHRPGNAIGWLFSAVGLLEITGVLAMEYAGYGYISRPGSLPGAVRPPGISSGGLRYSSLSLCSPCCCFPPAGC